MYIEDKNIFISAVLTMHNEELYLEQCIDSILDQDHTRVRDKKRLEKVGNLVKNSYLYR